MNWWLLWVSCVAATHLFMWIMRDKKTRATLLTHGLGVLIGFITWPINLLWSIYYIYRRSGFLGAMAGRFIEIGRCTPRQAREMAWITFVGYLTDEGISFLAPGHSWGIDGAYALADEEMECWEAA